MATFVALRHHVTILVTALTNPDNLTNDHKTDLLALTIEGPTREFKFAFCLYGQWL